MAIAPPSASPMKKMPASEAIDGQAGDEHRVAAGRGGGLERGQLAGAARPLLALTLEVEERVVDADGHADQHHQDLRALAGRR